MNISANTLFHFTNEKDNLLSILKNGFYHRLCLEKNELYSKPYNQMAIPMVCFCDIPLGNILQHMNTYGNYALGLSKEWARKKGITPVLYANNDSLALDSLRKQLYYINEELTSSETDAFNKEILDGIFYFTCYIKQYEEMDLNIHAKGKRFYDEREWRYVPSFSAHGEQRLILSKIEFDNTDNKENINTILEKNPLKYSIKDINYIIVNSDKDILDVKHSIEAIKGGRYSPKELELLVTKIISAEKITNDF